LKIVLPAKSALNCIAFIVRDVLVGKGLILDAVQVFVDSVKQCSNELLGVVLCVVLELPILDIFGSEVGVGSTMLLKLPSARLKAKGWKTFLSASHRCFRKLPYFLAMT